MLFSHGPAGAKSGDGNDKIYAPAILVVEDNPVMQRVTKMQLEELGYRVDIAENGVEALQVLEQMSFDIIFMDCQMSEMDGYEATRRIRETDSICGTHTTIIALTTQGLVADRQRCLEVGMDDYLHKPVTKDQLKKMLDKWLAGRRPPGAS
jgi:CheY-like chemotaxis protein